MLRMSGRSGKYLEEMNMIKICEILKELILRKILKEEFRAQGILNFLGENDTQEYYKCGE